MAELRAYACGSTSHDLFRLVRGAPRERREYPAGVFLYIDGDRRVLFDTGYAPLPWHAGPAAWLYRRLLPPRVASTETVAAVLRADGIESESITHVVLSHLHPDHIGGLRFFPGATLVLSRAASEAWTAPRLKEGILRRLVPGGLADRRRLIVPGFTPGPVGLSTFDLFDDGSYLLVDLPGHARGHMGALIEGHVLLAADAAWTRGLLGREADLRAVPRAVAHDPEILTRTARALLRAESEGIELVFSHDPQPARIGLS